MAEITYRVVGLDDLEEVARIYSDVYVLGLDSARRDARTDFEDGHSVQFLGAFEGDRLASVLQVVDYTIFLGPNRVSMGGIAGVATHAENRRNHLVANLLKMSLERMREKGTLTSMLYPFSRAFYRKYGWEHACDALELKAKVNDLHSLNAAAVTGCSAVSEFVRVDIDSLDRFIALDSVYSSCYSRYNCAVVRSAREWDRFRRSVSKSVASGTNNYVYMGTRAGEPVSYIAYTLRKGTGDGRTLWIREAAAVDGRAWIDLLGFIAKHDAQAVDLEGIVPLDSPIRSLLGEPSRNGMVAHLMFRIVDVARLFGSLSAEGLTNCQFAIGVTDRTCEWNNKVFSVAVEDGRITAAPSLHSDADIRMDISTLSQIASGYASAASAARTGLASVSDIRSLSLLGRILPAKPTFSCDYF